MKLYVDWTFRLAQKEDRRHCAIETRSSKNVSRNSVHRKDFLHEWKVAQFKLTWCLLRFVTGTHLPFKHVKPRLAKISLTYRVSQKYALSEPWSIGISWSTLCKLPSICDIYHIYILMAAYTMLTSWCRWLTALKVHFFGTPCRLSKIHLY